MGCGASVGNGPDKYGSSKVLPSTKHGLFVGDGNKLCGEGVLQYRGWLSHLDLGELLPVQLDLEVRAGGTELHGTWKVFKTGRFALHAWTAGFDHPMPFIASTDALGGWRSTWTQDPSLCHGSMRTLEFGLAACRAGAAVDGIAALKNGAALCGRVRSRASAPFSEEPVPVASWNFKLLHEEPREPYRPEVQCHRGATWGPQGLVFDQGVDGYFLTEPIDVEITEKTLEVYFQLSDLDQVSSGVISFGFMNDASAAFDSITYNQRRPHEWLNCSNFFSRTVNVGGLAETSLEPLHMVVTYRKDGLVTMYRNGVPYGTPYIIDHQLTLPAGQGRILLGARHVWPGPATSVGVRGEVGLADGHQVAGPFSGRIEYAALYDSALTADQVASRAGTGFFKLWPSIKRPLAGPGDADYLLELRRNFPPNKRNCIQDPAKRCMTLAQLNRVLLFAMEHCCRWTGSIYRDGQKLHEQLSMDVLSLYHVNEWLIRPSTRASDQEDSIAWDCSFAELLGGSAEQRAIWFVSHWWGEAIRDFIRCVQRHVFLRGSSENSFYWVCAYANRQHRLSDDIGVGLEHTSFYKAISSSAGVLVILDNNATPFRRIWCAFEEFVALKDGIVVDIATCSNGEPMLLAGSVTAHDKQDMLPMYHKAAREKEFPVSVIAKSLGFDIRAAEASVDKDREDILAWMEASEENGIERVGDRLRSHFSIAAWRQCVELGIVLEYKLPEFVQTDSGRGDFVFDFSFQWSFTDADAEALASAMHTGIRNIDLNFEWCVNLSSRGLGHLVERVAACSCLEVLVLNIRECTGLDGACVGAFLRRLPSSIQGVHLKYHKKATHEDCVCLGDAVAGLLALPLQSLHLSFRDCLELDKSALKSVLSGLTASTSLSTCELSFEGTKIDNNFLAVLADERLPLDTMEIFCLNVRHCRGVGVSGILNLTRQLLSKAPKLQSVSLHADAVHIKSKAELAAWFIAAERLGLQVCSFDRL